MQTASEVKTSKLDGTSDYSIPSFGETPVTDSNFNKDDRKPEYSKVFSSSAVDVFANELFKKGIINEQGMIIDQTTATPTVPLALLTGGLCTSFYPLSYYEKAFKDSYGNAPDKLEKSKEEKLMNKMVELEMQKEVVDHDIRIGRVDQSEMKAMQKTLKNINNPFASAINLINALTLVEDIAQFSKINNNSDLSSDSSENSEEDTTSSSKTYSDLTINLNEFGYDENEYVD